MSYTLSQLAEMLGARLVGQGDGVIERVAPIEEAAPGSISFVSSAKFARYLQDCKAGAVIISEDLLELATVPALVVANPRADYARIVNLLYAQPKAEAGIHPSAVVAPSARVSADASIGANVVIEANACIEAGAVIGPGCVIGKDSVIGSNTLLHANVTVYYGCTLGENCIIHSASVIGADGFGFELDQGEWLKILQVGGVKIGNNVEIGACSTVDRGAVRDTIIEEGVKLDNHIQIGHNARIGAHTLMSNGVGVAGSTVIGKHCLIGGMTGIRDNIEIADNVTITGMSLVSKSLTKAGSYSSNTPIDDTRTWRKNSARFRQLDELAKRIRQLEKQLENNN
ncbi:MAG: UDP-3-O-(3-hydroxymyristoyl)glucosamine N-acyltransferase [Gammaproteobacteria bacterium]|nr:UDP-3-O-(3-hydroxymyristoyl)glucosamine N-acyltransferase [Gammaproteobacteria bacterium]